MCDDICQVTLVEPVTPLRELGTVATVQSANPAVTVAPLTPIISLTQVEPVIQIMQTAGVGPIGPSGTSDKYYVHTQNSASTVWTITHNLAKNPAVTVVDSGGTVVIGQLAYIDTNTATVTFSVAFGGYAYCD